MPRYRKIGWKSIQTVEENGEKEEKQQESCNLFNGKYKKSPFVIKERITLYTFCKWNYGMTHFDNHRNEMKWKHWFRCLCLIYRTFLFGFDFFPSRFSKIIGKFIYLEYLDVFFVFFPFAYRTIAMHRQRNVGIAIHTIGISLAHYIACIFGWSFCIGTFFRIREVHWLVVYKNESRLKSCKILPFEPYNFSSIHLIHLFIYLLKCQIFFCG